MLTPENKLAMYRAGDYRLPVPPVLTHAWSEKDWIRFIDQHGAWGAFRKTLKCGNEVWLFNGEFSDSGEPLYSPQVHQAC